MKLRYPALRELQILYFCLIYFLSLVYNTWFISYCLHKSCNSQLDVQVLNKHDNTLNFMTACIQLKAMFHKKWLHEICICCFLTFAQHPDCFGPVVVVPRKKTASSHPITDLITGSDPLLNHVITVIRYMFR